MRLQIENEKLRAEIESFGAELKSLVRKGDNQEYLWEADPAFWGKTSPILFPFIGKLANLEYCYQGKSYTADKHGFARDMDYRVTVQEKDRIVLSIESTEETLAKYPFPFALEVEYRLEGNSLSEQWRVHNQGSETMYFSIGGHPAFACPLVKNGTREGKRTDCFVKLYGAEDKGMIQSTEIDVSVGLLSGRIFPVTLKEGIFPIVEHIFDSDALVFAEQGVTGAALLDHEGREYIRMEAPSCPVWGICDSKDYRGTLEERPYTNQAEPGEIWEDGFRIIVGE